MEQNENPDRRNRGERRSSTRYTVNFDVEWGLHGILHAGTISDLSDTGCFVLTGADVADGEEVELLLPIGDGVTVRFVGTIMNHVHEIGFAVEFKNMSEAQRAILLNYLGGEKKAVDS